MRIRIDPVFRFQAAPGIVFADPQQIAKLIRLFPRDADLVGVVVGQVEFLILVVQEYMRQGFVAVLVGVDVGVGAFVVIFLDKSAAVPNKHGSLRVGAVQAAFVDALFADSAAKGVVGVLPLLHFAIGFVQFGADELVFGVVFEQLAFAVGQFAVDKVAQGVVLVSGAVEFGDPVAAGAVQAAFAGVSGQLVEDIACGVEGELLFGVLACVGGFKNPAQFVIGVMGGAASEVGAADEVAGFVVAGFLCSAVMYSELNLNQYSVGSPCRTICTVCGSPPCPDLNLIHYKRLPEIFR